MANNIDLHFVQQFEAELFTAFQNTGGFMRTRSRRKTGVVGSRAHFPKIGLAPAAAPKTRKGRVPLMDILRDRVFCDLEDRYGADMIDDLDQLKTNVDEKSAVQSAIINSLARAEDDFALNALATSNNAANNLATNDSWVSDAVPRSVLQVFGQNEAIEGGSMNAAVSWRSWNDLLSLNTFINSEFGGDTQLTSEGQRPKMFFGFAYVPFSRLPLHSTGAPLNMWWHKNCVGVAVGKEVSAETDYLKEYDSHYIMGKLSLGSVLIEATGVILRRYTP